MSELTTIESGGVSITVDAKGAQLMSLSTERGEYLWQGDERWWPRRAPVLFPIVGNLRGDAATSAEGDVRLGRHGLARNHVFDLIDLSDSSLTYRLASNEVTLGQFPYYFQLEMTYSISDGAVRQTFLVTNTGDVDLPYVVGGHPAFNVPAPGAGGEDFAQYRLEFATPWTYGSPRINTETGLLDFSDRIALLDDSSSLGLSHALFDVDTLVFEDVPERSVRLVGPQGHGMQVDFEGFDYLGVWSAANDAPFVALEPWTGCATATDEDDVFEHKRGISTLSPGGRREHAFEMRPF
ncbi:MAG: aldose 1-epimerase family protein [Olsenella sp.]|nr:aldose 1-epimerase family protein [Olsenella sp.]